MDFTSLAFIAFLAIAAVAYRLASPRLRPLVLLMASYIFYYSNSRGLILLLVGGSALVYFAALILQRPELRRARFAITCFAAACLIGTLIFFKSTYLLSGSWVRQLVIPMGMSYYTFKLLGYLIDVYWEAFEAETSFIRFAAFTAFFPQIVAGPIQRSQQFLPQLTNPRNATSLDVLLGCHRILLGCFKKFVVADNLAILVNFIYGHLHTVRSPVILAFYGYPLQMYADFSALTDISIGAALLFGISAPENFEAPFSAVSPSEYWRRWHITLTTWLTDYVFTPLRMSTRGLGNAGLVFSLTANMVLIGLWHGFRWTFVVFGLVHALYLSVDALSAKARRDYYKTHSAAKRLAGRIGPITTFHLTAIAFVCFRADTVQDALFVVRHLFTAVTEWAPLFAAFVLDNQRNLLIGLSGYAVAEGFDWLRRRNARTPIVPFLPRWSRWSVYSCTAITLGFVVMLLLVNGAHRSPFLYAIF